MNYLKYRWEHWKDCKTGVLISSKIFGYKNRKPEDLKENEVVDGWQYRNFEYELYDDDFKKGAKDWLNANKSTI